MIYSTRYPKQMGGDIGCMCRTCGLVPAIYMDQCESCRANSSMDDDRNYLRPGGEWDRRRESDRREILSRPKGPGVPMFVHLANKATQAEADDTVAKLNEKFPDFGGGGRKFATKPQPGANPRIEVGIESDTSVAEADLRAVREVAAT